MANYKMKSSRATIDPLLNKVHIRVYSVPLIASPTFSLAQRARETSQLSQTKMRHILNPSSKITSIFLKMAEEKYCLMRETSCQTSVMHTTIVVLRLQARMLTQIVRALVLCAKKIWPFSLLPSEEINSISLRQADFQHSLKTVRVCTMRR